MMKISIEVDMDVSNIIEQRFLQFHEEHPTMTKSLLLCGYLMIEQGVASYYDEKYKNDLDGIWKNKFNKEVQRSDYLEEQLSQLKAVYDDKYTRMYELRLQAKDDEMNIKLAQVMQVNQRCADLENQLHNMQARQQIEVREKIEERLLTEKHLQDEYRKQINELREKCCFYEAEYRTALAKSTDFALASIKDSQICQLENEITRLKTELQCFKGTNIYKGQKGEKAIRDIIANYFTNFEIVDASKTGGASDVHVFTETGDIFVLESKNKSIITAQDIDKSYDDIELLESQYQEQLKGYVFVSHRTKNIPKKGNLHIERRKNMYIAWIGLNENDGWLDVYIITVLKLLISISKCHFNTDNDAMLKLNLETLTSALKDKLNILSENIKLCNMLQDNINTMALSLNNVQNNNKELYDSILQMSGLTQGSIQNSQHFTRLDKGTLKREKVVTKLQCSQCNQIFKRKCDLTQHLSKAHQ